MEEQQNQEQIHFKHDFAAAAAQHTMISHKYLSPDL